MEGLAISLWHTLHQTWPAVAVGEVSPTQSGIWGDGNVYPASWPNPLHCQWKSVAAGKERWQMARISYACSCMLPVCCMTVRGGWGMGGRGGGHREGTREEKGKGRGEMVQ